MFGIVGSLMVIAQMAFLAMGFPTHIALICGLIAAILWIFHALERNDKPLLFVNFCVGGFAFYGLLA